MLVKYRILICGLFGLWNVIFIVFRGIVVFNIIFYGYDVWVGDISICE